MSSAESIRWERHGRQPNTYIHKLRLEAREGAFIEVRAPKGAGTAGVGWLLTKFVIAVVVLSATLAVSAGTLHG